MTSSDVSIVNFEHISQLFQVPLLFDFKHVLVCWVLKSSEYNKVKLTCKNDTEAKF